MDLSGILVNNICLIVKGSDIQMVFWIADNIAHYSGHGLNNRLYWASEYWTKWSAVKIHLVIWIPDNFACYLDTIWISTSQQVKVPFSDVFAMKAVI